ncbi:alpha/beta hydrolase [Cerasicoccus arenae]|uniref:Endo-1,4-beta-xylanase n=1 Tax=Cerasicoccus arenae TaxID=424488 RepID=A0A8J3DIY6_9BACT|nr:alpha/beta hydrolase [Cerasicoccus arenae]MBK1858931.1 alpha/beta hydrolase [Cerasicoccus arenae]GHC08280.1 endo-1,4-beta-xylanase [Cerasicoccus arenae]
MDALHTGLPVTIRLWENGTPFADDALPGLPRLTIYLPSPEHRTGQSIVVCPGGGYAHLAIAHEGHRVARYISSHGTAAAVLEYRHAPYRHPVPLLDAQRAIRLMRHHATEWELDPSKVGILGFSAGGHLTACAATLPPLTEGLPGDEIDALDCRPDFAVPIYAVVSIFEPYAHLGSRQNLLGEKADDMELVAQLSPERHVNANTPPCLLIHTSEDKSVVPEHSIVFYQALRRHNVPAELHIYEKHGHGIGLAQNHPWGPALIEWLKNRT